MGCCSRNNHTLGVIPSPPPSPQQPFPRHYTPVPPHVMYISVVYFAISESSRPPPASFVARASPHNPYRIRSEFNKLYQTCIFNRNGEQSIWFRHGNEPNNIHASKPYCIPYTDCSAIYGWGGCGVASSTTHTIRLIASVTLLGVFLSVWWWWIWCWCYVWFCVCMCMYVCSRASVGNIIVDQVAHTNTQTHTLTPIDKTNLIIDTKHDESTWFAY